MCRRVLLYVASNDLADGNVHARVLFPVFALVQKLEKLDLIISRDQLWLGQWCQIASQALEVSPVYPQIKKKEFNCNFSGHRQENSPLFENVYFFLICLEVTR